MSGSPNRRARYRLAVLALIVACGLATLAPGVARAQTPAASVLDEILDQYVRDGLVYYAALRIERRAIDRYIQSLADEPQAFEAWSRDRRLAFWINGYNALVLRTVIDHYPIQGASAEFPTNSVMNVPGMFTGREHLIAGRRMTLEAIENEVASFGDPRAILALGRGAVGSPRLRSEAFRDSQLEAQLQAVVEDFATTPRHVTLDCTGDEVSVNAVLGWRSGQFEGAAPSGGDSNRTALERAIVAIIKPALFPSEQAFLEQNTFRLRYIDFDWRLNDLTGGPPR